MDTCSLSNSEQQRYSRHLLLPEVGIQGQQKLKDAKVLVIGAGGLGSPIILYLAAAGIGRIGIVDFDSVDVSNLQRQIIYINDDVSRSKVESAARRASALNPEIDIQEINTRLAAENALDLFQKYDLIIDGSDNFSTRYLVNDACVLTQKPYVYGSIYRFEGQASVFSLNAGPCYRCLFPDPPPPDAVPNCAEGGVLGVMAGLIGCIQATEALKIILEVGESLSGKLLLYDALSMTFDSLSIKKNPDCPICGPNPSIKKLEDITVSCRAEVPMTVKTVTVKELDQERKAGKQIVLLDVRSAQEVAFCNISGYVHIPLQELPDRLAELDKNADIVAYCRSGARSHTAAEILNKGGFQNVRNLEGGILAWADQIDSSIPKY